MFCETFVSKLEQKALACQSKRSSFVRSASVRQSFRCVQIPRMYLMHNSLCTLSSALGFLWHKKEKAMQKAEKGKLYLLFKNTFHLIVSLAKRGNLRLQKEKEGKKQGQQQGSAEPLPSLADPWSAVCHCLYYRQLQIMAKNEIQPMKKAVSHTTKKCQSEVCCSLNTESTLGPGWRSSEMLLSGNLAQAGIQVCSDPQHALHSISKALYAKFPFDYTFLLQWIRFISYRFHPSLESSGRFALSTHITEQTKLVFIWKDTNMVWQCFLCRPDKQEQERGLERWVSFEIELILFSFKNVSLLYI